MFKVMNKHKQLFDWFKSVRFQCNQKAFFPALLHGVVILSLPAVNPVELHIGQRHTHHCDAQQSHMILPVAPYAVVYSLSLQVHLTCKSSGRKNAADSFIKNLVMMFSIIIIIKKTLIPVRTATCMLEHTYMELLL